MKTRLVDLSTLRPDPDNARRHTPENIRVIQAALEDVGPGRSIVLDEDNVTLAGNGVVEACLAAGITKVLIVEADGHSVIAVRRSHLTPAQKRRLSIVDNRANELSQWDAPVLRAQLTTLDAQVLGFLPEELAALLKERIAPDAFATLPDRLETTHRCSSCGYEW